MQKIVNSGRFILQAYLADPEKEAALTPLAAQILALAEQFSPGTRAAAERNLPNLAKAITKGRAGSSDHGRSGAGWFGWGRKKGNSG
jgi:hypothetical protein